MRSRFAAAAALAAAALLAACSTAESLLQGKPVDYQSAATLPSLEIPPDLTAPGNDNRYALPAGGQTTLSSYESSRAKESGAESATVLPKYPEMHIARDGSERWLVVANETPAQLWPVLRDFWQSNGFLLKLEQPQLGIMETDWAEDRAKLPSEMGGLSLQRIIGPLYSTGTRDRFRTRLEHTPDGKGTEVYISHQGLEEVYTDREQVNLAWQPRPPDPGLEAVFLRRLMVRLGAKQELAKQQVAAAEANPLAEVSQGSGGAQTLTVHEPFDRAWRRVGLALDRIGFTVEDRNRDKGVYYVRYADPEAPEGSEKKGFFASLAFWRSNDKKVVAEQYRVVVKEAKDDSVVEVQDKTGANVNSETSRRIISLLEQQLK
ncbi:MAG TPA: outer membrane protein assembly factor BamC [Burkholderiales bacterium]|nr:outer membrane protein assembly factor BamC [Burkholderiales bacterium]